jgi:hypothetical protein
VDRALRVGRFRLKGGSTLASLLATARGERNPKNLPPFRAEQILAWADACHARTSRWPITRSGPIEESPGDSWRAVDTALRYGGRGLPGGSSLAQLLAEHRGRYNFRKQPRITVDDILAWADAYQARTGKRPTRSPESIPESPGLTWATVYTALRKGGCGLPGGMSLVRLLAERHGSKQREAGRAFPEGAPHPV